MNSRYFKDAKIGEGTFAVVYSGWSVVDPLAALTSRAGEEEEDRTAAPSAPGPGGRIKAEGEGEDLAVAGHRGSSPREQAKQHPLPPPAQPSPTTGRFKIAIKKIKSKGHQHLDISSLRELASLRELSHHPHIIRLLDVFHHKGSIHMVLPFIPTDLETIIKRKSVVFSNAHVKSWMLMLLRGLDCIHELGWLHRDLKPNNLLLDRQGLKIADFGLCRPLSMHEMTPEAITRWYRPPELLLGARRYAYSVDMWSVGCIFAEMCLRVPFVAGDTDLGQLELIFKALGTPTLEQWPGMDQLPGYFAFNTHPKPDLAGLFSALGRDGLALLFSLLVYDPRRRCSAREALDSAYFQNEPAPTLPCFLPGATDTGAEGAEAPAAQEAERQRKRKRAEQELGGSKIARKLF